ncbi:vacuolar protein sorting-associated protein 74 [Trichoderma pleuroticola]
MDMGQAISETEMLLDSLSNIGLGSLCCIGRFFSFPLFKSPSPAASLADSHRLVSGLGLGSFDDRRRSPESAHPPQPTPLPKHPTKPVSMSSSGLTRRRGAGGVAGTEGESSNGVSRTNSTRDARDSGPETSYESGENGHKIAFDPRDISESAERSKQPKLTMMEEVLLLGLKDKQGYLSFWNDNISYALRGCIVLELAFRGRISMEKDPARRRFPLADRNIEVIDDTLTGEVLLDEALKMMKQSEKMSVSSWIDLMSGETWNLMKIGYQLKQVRERLAKGLVDKGILRTEKRNFLLFDMATHPVADGGAKEEIRRRVRNVLTQRTVVLNGSQFLPENLEFRYLRTVSMVCAAYAANVLENALSTLGHEARERAFAQTDELLADYSQYPFGKKATGNGIGANLPQVIAEEVNKAKDKELQLEIVAACLSVFTRLDSLL